MWYCLNNNNNNNNNNVVLLVPSSVTLRMYTPFHASFRYVTIYIAELRTAVQRGSRLLSFHRALRLIHGRQGTIRAI